MSLCKKFEKKGNCLLSGMNREGVSFQTPFPHWPDFLCSVETAICFSPRIKSRLFKMACIAPYNITSANLYRVTPGHSFTQALWSCYLGSVSVPWTHHVLIYFFAKPPTVWKNVLSSVQITPAYSLGLDKNITSSYRTSQTSLIRISLLATHSRAPKCALAWHSLGFIEVAGMKSVSLMDSAQWRQCHLFPTVSSVHGNMSDI